MLIYNSLININSNIGKHIKSHLIMEIPCSTIHCDLKSIYNKIIKMFNISKY